MVRPQAYFLPPIIVPHCLALQDNRSFKQVQVDRICKYFHVGAAVGTLVVVLLLPLSSAMDDCEFDHGGDGGNGGGLVAAAAVAAAAAVDDDWR